MEYTPQSEKDIRSKMVLTPGIYDFEVVKAIEKQSKNGNDMIELTVRVFPADDTAPRLVRDWLVAGSGLGELKINRFCHATGLQDDYFAGRFNALSCEGATGKLRTTITSDEKYGDQCSIRDYLVEKKSEAAPAKQSAKQPAKPKAEPSYEEQLAAAGDDIPF